MKILITGGAGFIGSHLAEASLARNHEVFVIDDLSTGKIENIEHLKTNERFHYFIDTIMNRPLMAELVDRSDVIFHLAASVGVRLIVDSPVKTIETNIKGTEILLGLAEKKRKKVIVASTSEVYGKSTKVPFREDDDMVLGPTTRGRWSYACSKAIDEFLALAYNKEKKLPVVVARLFNTVGPRQTGHYGMVIPSLVSQALQGIPITVYGDGTQTRCFCHVSDVVRGLLDLANESGAVGRVFNLGSTEEIRILELAELIKQTANSESEIVFVEYDKAYEEGFEDMMRRVPDITRVSNLIGYKPTHDIKEIVQEVVEYFRASS